ncbi:uncharacterized protein LOC144439953 [Glandiceps talaboti]
MASANIGKEIDDQFLQCPICIDRFYHPKTLPKCGHTVCETCLEGIVSRNYGRLKCPICRVDNSSSIRGNSVATLPDSFLLNSLIEYVDHKTKQENEAYGGDPCGICSRSATVYCTICDQLQCDDCRERHLKITVTKDHTIVSIEEYNSTPVKLLRPANCTTHNGNQVQMFCETCSVPVCIECIITSHQGDHHKHITLKTAAEKKRAKLVALTEKVNGKIPAFKTARDKLRKTLEERTAERTKLYKQVTAKTSSVIQEMRKIEQARLQQIQGHYALELETLERSIDHFDELSDKAEKITRMSNEMLWSNIDALVFFMEKQHLSQLQDISSQTTHIPIQSRSKLEFHEGSFSLKPSDVIGELSIDVKQETPISSSSLSNIQISETPSRFISVNVIKKYGRFHDSKLLKEPRGLCLLDDEQHFLVSAMGNNAVLKYSVRGRYKSLVHFEKPFDVAAFRTHSSIEGNLLISNGQFLTRCNENGDTYFCEDLEDTSHPLGITTSADQTKVYCVVAKSSNEVSEDSPLPHVQVPSTSSPGTTHQTSIMFWDVSAIKERQHLTFGGDCRFVAVNSRNQIITTDSRSGTVKVISSETKQCLFSFGSQCKNSEGNLVSPLGVATDPGDNIYVCSKGRVLMYSSRGSFLCRVDKDTDKLYHPFAICITKRRPCTMIVTSEDEDGNGRIVIYKEI